MGKDLIICPSLPKPPGYDARHKIAITKIFTQLIFAIDLHVKIITQNTSNSLNGHVNDNKNTLQELTIYNKMSILQMIKYLDSNISDPFFMYYLNDCLGLSFNNQRESCVDNIKIELIVDIYPNSIKLLNPNSGNVLLHYYLSIEPEEIDIIVLEKILNFFPEAIKLKNKNGLTPLHVYCKSFAPNDNILLMLMSKCTIATTIECPNGYLPIHMLLTNKTYKPSANIIRELLKLNPRSAIQNVAEEYLSISIGIGNHEPIKIKKYWNPLEKLRDKGMIHVRTYTKIYQYFHLDNTIYI